MCTVYIRHGKRLEADKSIKKISMLGDGLQQGIRLWVIHIMIGQIYLDEKNSRGDSAVFAFVDESILI